jgi:hypothetical protein
VEAMTLLQFVKRESKSSSPRATAEEAKSSEVFSFSVVFFFINLGSSSTKSMNEELEEELFFDVVLGGTTGSQKFSVTVLLEEGGKSKGAGEVVFLNGIGFVQVGSGSFLAGLGDNFRWMDLSFLGVGGPLVCNRGNPSRSRMATERSVHMRVLSSGEAVSMTS